MKRKRILLISHESSFSGASLSFCFLAEQLVQFNKDIDFDVLLLGEGPLVERYYKNFQNVYFPYCISENSISRNIRKIARKLNLLKSYKDKLLQKLIHNQYDLIVGNTIGSLQWLTDLKTTNKDVKTIVIIHELDIIIKNYYPVTSLFTADISKCELIITVSNVARLNLMNRYDLSSEKIKMINPYVQNLKTFGDKILHKKTRTFRIGLMGYLSLIKGSDLVPRIAFLLQTTFGVEDFSFTFFGIENNEAQNSIRNVILSDATKLGVVGKIYFKERKESPKSFFENMDVFLMISREESYSLATIESILSETPVVLFDDIGGPNEILKKEEAYFSPYLDSMAISKNLFEVYSDNTLAFQKTLKAKERITKIQYNSSAEYNKIILDYA